MEPWQIGCAAALAAIAVGVGLAFRRMSRDYRRDKED